MKGIVKRPNVWIVFRGFLSYLFLTTSFPFLCITNPYRKRNRKIMVGRGVHFLWRGSFTRRIISVQSSCNLSRKNETQGKTKPKISGRSANELIISWTIRNQRKTKDTRWRGLEGVSVPWMVLASCSFSRLSKEIENETHGGWWQQKTRTWNTWFFYYFTLPFVCCYSLILEGVREWNRTILEWNVRSQNGFIQHTLGSLELFAFPFLLIQTPILLMHL